MAIALGVIMLAFVVAFSSLAGWQFRRLGERREHNAVLSERASLPVVDFTELLTDPALLPPDVAYRRVTATGEFVTDDELLLAGRTRNTLAGHNVVTPLKVGEAAILVNRGWVPLNQSKPPVAEAAPPEGTVEVTGILYPSQERGRFGPKHPTAGRLEVMHRIEIPRIQGQISYPLYGYYLLLESQDPPQSGEFPASIDIPKLDEGPHLSYALQWIAFAIIAAATYVAMLVQASRKKRRVIEETSFA